VKLQCGRTAFNRLISDKDTPLKRMRSRISRTT